MKIEAYTDGGEKGYANIKSASNMESNKLTIDDCEEAEEQIKNFDVYIQNLEDYISLIEDISNPDNVENFKKKYPSLVVEKGKVLSYDEWVKKYGEANSAFTDGNIFGKYLEEYKEGGVAEIAYMKEPQKTVMNGAALYGLYPTQIIKRIINSFLKVLFFNFDFLLQVVLLS